MDLSLGAEGCGERGVGAFGARLQCVVGTSRRAPPVGLPPLRPPVRLGAKGVPSGGFGTVRNRWARKPEVSGVAAATGSTGTMDEDFTPLAYSLSPPAEAVHRTTEWGYGLLSVGRAWVRYEGWLMKEAGLAGGWHMRYFYVNGSRLEYFKEETVKLTLGASETLGGSIDRSNVVTALDKPGGAHAREKLDRGLQEGDVIIGVNGEAVLHGRLAEAVSRARASGGGAALQLTVLRPKGKISLAGATVSIGGGRKQGGYTLQVGNIDSSSRKSRHTLVCADERSCFGWVASIREAIAAAAMETIKSTISQALQLQALQSSRSDDTA